MWRRKNTREAPRRAAGHALRSGTATPTWPRPCFSMRLRASKSVVSWLASLAPFLVVLLIITSSYFQFNLLKPVSLPLSR